MKVEKINKEDGKSAIAIELAVEDAGLLQSVTLQFAEHIANSKKHAARMRRLAILIDKNL